MFAQSAVLSGMIAASAATPSAAKAAAGAPIAAPAPTPIGTDRPTRSNVARAVPEGDVRIESGAVNRTRLSSGLSSGGTITETVLYANPAIKYGLGSSTDIDANIAPYTAARAHGQEQRLTPAAGTMQIALTAYVEFWNSQSFDPAGTIRQYSADVASAYPVAPTLQPDLGANVGLDRFTPEAQIHAGISTRL